MDTSTTNNIHEAVAAVYGAVAKSRGQTTCCTVQLQT